MRCNFPREMGVHPFAMTNRSESLDRLTLRSRLSDMAQLPPWIAGLASRYGIPSEVQFGIELCLEEVVSNVIRHGYGGAEDRSVVIRFVMPHDKYFEFVVEDEAPRFNPLDAPDLKALNAEDDARVGGQGIRLLREFADAVEYEPMPSGNRLRIGFSSAGRSTTTTESRSTGK
jgi:anti-sigma regulatory factor (Ser/Thr protein kinase)